MPLAQMGSSRTTLLSSSTRVTVHSHDQTKQLNHGRGQNPRMCVIKPTRHFFLAS
jgi:hypothetical protein